MQAVTGVLGSQTDAERAVSALRSIGLPEDRITVLMPGKGKPSRPVPVSETEQPGMGKAIGGVVGAATGTAAGFQTGALISAAIPGVGPVIVAGLLGAAVLGLAGIGVGVAAGGALENATTQGLPEDELFVYEDALRKGRTVVIAMADDDAAADGIRQVFDAEGAESIDSARRQWWIGLRSAEEEHYNALGRNFTADEEFYRLGFEAALHSRNRCKQYDQILSEMAVQIEELQRRYPNSNVEEPFRRGHERGRAYYEKLCNRMAA